MLDINANEGLEGKFAIALVRGHFDSIMLPSMVAALIVLQAALKLGFSVFHPQVHDHIVHNSFRLLRNPYFYR